jgi:hypothetical protein
MSDNIIGRRQKVDNPDHTVIKPNLFFYISIQNMHLNI